MELLYYLSLLPIAVSKQIAVIPYDASSGVGNFTGGATELELNDFHPTLGSGETENLNDFTLFLTFTKQESNAQFLFTNTDGTDGWSLGITAGNFLFVESRSPIDYNHVFTNINLGIKNCIVIKVSSNVFSIYKYDLVSQEFESAESFIFPPSVELNSGNGIVMGGTISSMGSHVNNAITRFTGRLEQLLLLDGAYEDYYLLQILLGFQPRTLTYSSVVNSFIKYDDSYRYDGITLQNNHTFFENYLTSLNSGMIAGSATGKWFGVATGRFYSGNFSGQLSLATGLTACYGTGVFYTQSYTGGVTGVAGTGFFVDTIRYVQNSGYAMISHNIEASGFPYSSVNRMDYDAYYKVDSSSGASIVSNSDYYTGFTMNGVTSEHMNLVILGTDTGNRPSQYNLEGQFDNINQYFYLPDFSTGLIYFEGSRVAPANYSLADGVLDVFGVVESGDDQVVYDNSTGVTLMYLGLKGFATGNFYPNSAIVFSGEFSYTGVKRSQRKYFFETSSHHLYHGCKIQQGEGEAMFNL